MPFTDYLKNLRYDQLFGDGSMQNNMDGQPMNNIIGPPQQQPLMPETSQFEPRQYQPEHQASDMFSGLLNSMPQRPNPSMISKIFAGMAGLGGDNVPERQNNIMYGNYDRGVEDWKTKTGVAGQAANMERQNNVLAKSAFDTGESRRMTQQRNDEYVRRGDTAARTADANIKSKDAKDLLEKQKQELVDFKAKNPHYIFKTGDDGFVHGINPQTGKSIKTDVKSNEMSPIQKQQMQLDLIEARGDEARETAKVTAGLKPTETSTTTTDSTGKITKTLKTMKPVASHAPTNGEMTKTQRNKNTGETRIVVSTDGGKTWNVKSD